jgi:ABC-type bacteriocin/lantibiotic exporter with double-glycine peptidase domain
MLERKRFWECANGKLVVLDKDKTNQNPNEHKNGWPKFSKQLCKNIYLLLSIVNIELIMFSADLNQAVKNQFFLDFFHFNERKVTDVITLNFKLSRLYALGRILTTHFLKLTSKIEERNELKLGGKIVDQSAYLKRLQYFTRQTVSLLIWMRTNEKFKLSEKHGFWWWMKNSEKNVFEKFEEEMAKKEGGIFQWFHDQTERLIVSQFG